MLTATIKSGRHIRAVLLFVHLPASPRSAREALVDVTKQVGQVVAESVPLMVTGDLNVNAAKIVAADVPAGWTPLRTGAPTQRSDGELDWGLNNKLLRASNPTVVWPYVGAPAGGGLSDHSMLWYQVAV